MKSIIAEAQREPDACNHVTEPQPPILLYGVPFSELKHLCIEYAGTVKDAKGRKMRADCLCLMGGVVSCPSEADAERWEAIKDDSIEWLIERYGERLGGFENFLLYHAGYIVKRLDDDGALK